MDEKKIEILVVFQEKLALLMNERGFREDFLEPILYSGITDELLDKVVNHVLEEEEMKELCSKLNDADLKTDLRLLLKTLIERLSKFKTETNDDYIG